MKRLPGDCAILAPSQDAPDLSGTFGGEAGRPCRSVMCSGQCHCGCDAQQASGQCCSVTQAPTLPSLPPAGYIVQYVNPISCPAAGSRCTTGPHLVQEAVGWRGAMAWNCPFVRCATWTCAMSSTTNVQQDLHLAHQRWVFARCQSIPCYPTTFLAGVHGVDCHANTPPWVNRTSPRAAS